ncbi:MAG: hypothetical protein F6K10_14600 [Moorea sp. SIO2B7]|nr:hypothetical protein [Moorena sp. SIO2B7]
MYYVQESTKFQQDKQKNLINSPEMLASAIAAHNKILQEYKQAEAEVDKWLRGAKLALSKGDEDLARRAIEQKIKSADTVAKLKVKLDQQTIQVETLKRKMLALEGKCFQIKTQELRQMTQNNKDWNDKAEGAAFVAGGTAAGTGVAATVGGMGLVGGFGGVAIGAAPVAAAGAVVGSAVYGAKKAIEEEDASALGAIAVGAAGGAGVSALVGGMGLAVAGTAVGIGMAPVAAAGAVVGLAGYGLKKLLDK